MFGALYYLVILSVFIFIEVIIAQAPAVSRLDMAHDSQSR